MNRSSVAKIVALEIPFTVDTQYVISDLRTRLIPVQADIPTFIVTSDTEIYIESSEAKVISRRTTLQMNFTQLGIGGYIKNLRSYIGDSF